MQVATIFEGEVEAFVNMLASAKTKRETCHTFGLRIELRPPLASFTDCWCVDQRREFLESFYISKCLASNVQW
jgi:hypothetical protein